MKADLGFAVIGAGRIGALHARHLAGAVEGARLVRVVDPNLVAAERAALGGAAFGDVFEDALSDPAWPQPATLAMLRRLLEEHDLELDLDPSTDCVNVLLPGVDKAVGFRAMCAAIGVSEAAVAGIGDSVGDLPWLRLCGVSVAPRVSDEAVRAAVGHPSDLPDVEASLRTCEALIAANRAWVEVHGSR